MLMWPYVQEAIQVLKEEVTQMAEKMESLVQEETFESSVEENKVCIKFKLQHAIVMATRYIAQNQPYFYQLRVPL